MSWQAVRDWLKANHRAVTYAAGVALTLLMPLAPARCQNTVRVIATAVQTETVPAVFVAPAAAPEAMDGGYVDGGI